MPLPTWDHVYVDGNGFDWQDASILNMYISAMAERGVDLSSYGPFTAAGASGYNLQAKEVWQAMQNYFLGSVFVGGGLGRWLKPSTDLTGNLVTSVHPFGYDTPAMNFQWFLDNCKKSGAGEVGYTFPGANGTYRSAFNGALVSPCGFERQFPKEIDDLNALDYTGTFIGIEVGALARNLSNGKVYLCTAVSFFTGIGTWALQSPATLPDRFKNSAGVFGAGQFGNGIMQHGDYFGPHLLNQMRDAINMLTNHAGRLSDGAFGAWSAGGANNTKSGTGNDPVLATAKANAAAAYANSGTVDSAPYARARINGAGPYTARLDRRKAQFVSPTDADGLTPTVRFYSYLVLPDPNPDDLGNPFAFDANGDPVSETVYTKFDTGAAGGGGGSVTSAFLGGLGAPNFGAAAGSQGYGIASLFVPSVPPVACLPAFDYGVAGGFTYRP